MKKIIILLVLIFLFPVSVLAKSGACSGHGGVSCSAGQDSDGSVICNDGWRNSSVSYSSMVMCAGYSSAPIVTSVPKEERVVVPVPPVSVPTPKPAEIVVVPPQPKLQEVTPPATVKKDALKKAKPVEKKATPVAPVKEVEGSKEIKVKVPTPTQTQAPLPTKKKGFWLWLFGF